jgi:hypothetical protein
MIAVISCVVAVNSLVISAMSRVIAVSCRDFAALAVREEPASVQAASMSRSDAAFA